MYNATRRPRHWLLSSKFLIIAVGAVVLGVSALDGIAHNEIEHREIVPLLAVLAVAFFVAYRSDKLHAHIDGLEKRLTKLTEKPNS